jgi:hypothetical protein
VLSVANEILELAQNLAKFTQKTQTEPSGVMNLGFFVGTVKSKTSTRIRVTRPFDNTVLSLPYVSSASVLAAGDSCFVLVPGSLSKAIVLGYGNLSNL